MHALFITTPAPAEPFDAAESDQDGERTMDLQPGQIVMLEPGEEVQTSAPADSGQTKGALPRPFRKCLDRDSRSFRTTPVLPFQYRTLLQVSAALGIPYAYLSNDLARANYSNSRPALLEFRRRVEACRHAAPRGEWSGSCAGGCGRAGWMWRCCRALSLCRTMRRSGGRTSPARGCRRSGIGSIRSERTRLNGVQRRRAPVRRLYIYAAAKASNVRTAFSAKGTQHSSMISG